MLIPGGPADSSVFAPIRNVLSEHYTVVTYDPRGLSSSTLDGEPKDTTVQTFADDAHQLLAAIGNEPGYRNSITKPSGIRFRASLAEGRRDVRLEKV